MACLGGDPAKFVRWRNSIEIVIFGSGDGVWSEMDKFMGSLIIRTDAKSSVTFVKTNDKLYSVLYFLTNREATRILCPFRAKRGGHKGDGLGAWNALKKTYEGNTGQRHIELNE